MRSETKMEDIKQKVDKKPGLFDSVIERAMESQEANLPPKCYICKKRMFQGSVMYTLPTGDIVSVCMQCTLKAVGFYIQQNMERININEEER